MKLCRIFPPTIALITLVAIGFSAGADAGGLTNLKKKPGEKKVTAGGDQKGKDKVPGNKGGGRIKGGLMVVPFMGIRAKGRNFVIIADRSYSMLAGRKYWDYERKRIVRGKKTSMDYLKEELLKAVDACDKKSGQLFVYLYSTGVLKQPTATYARSKGEIDTVRKWVKKTQPKGETFPEKAFEMALQLKPMPDVIFFMSDGIVNQNSRLAMGRMLTSLPKDKRPTIHTIQLFVPGQDRASITMSRYDVLYGKQPLPTQKQGLIERLKTEHLLSMRNPLFRQRAVQEKASQRELMQTMAKMFNGEYNEIRRVPDSVSQK